MAQYMESMSAGPNPISEFSKRSWRRPVHFRPVRDGRRLGGGGYRASRPARNAEQSGSSREISPTDFGRRDCGHCPITMALERLADDDGRRFSLPLGLLVIQVIAGCCDDLGWAAFPKAGEGVRLGDAMRCDACGPTEPSRADCYAPQNVPDQQRGAENPRRPASGANCQRHYVVPALRGPSIGGVGRVSCHTILALVAPPGLPDRLGVGGGTVVAR
jgi:hypothetical protein